MSEQLWSDASLRPLKTAQLRELVELTETARHMLVPAKAGMLREQMGVRMRAILGPVVEMKANSRRTVL